MLQKLDGPSVAILFAYMNFMEKQHNKNRKVRSFESNENTQRQSVGHIAQFRIMNPHQ